MWALRGMAYDAPYVSLFSQALPMSQFKPTRRQGFAFTASVLATGIMLTASVATSLAMGKPAIAQSQRATPAAGLTANGMSFRQAMNVGYAYSRQGDFNTALINFQRALIIRPGNPYAAAAADNMAFYIEHERVTTRQRAISQLESRLERAISQQDWVCAATTLDSLTTYTAPGSLNRERLVGRRGEVSGMLDARLNHERWSTVCAAERPVY